MGVPYKARGSGWRPETAERGEPRIVLLICPPVGPFAAPERIEAWIVELGKIREMYPNEHETVDSNVEEAKEWLEFSKQLAIDKKERDAAGR